jgi:predicted RNase H-like HicB family nuclease
MNSKYKIVLSWSHEDQAYIAEIPELPGAMADGLSYREALTNAEIIIQEWIETAQALGRPVPKPQSQDQPALAEYSVSYA